MNKYEQEEYLADLRAFEAKENYRLNKENEDLKVENLKLRKENGDLNYLLEVEQRKVQEAAETRKNLEYKLGLVEGACRAIYEMSIPDVYNGEMWLDLADGRKIKLSSKRKEDG